MKGKIRKCVSIWGIILESSSMMVHLLSLRLPPPHFLLAQYSRKEELKVNIKKAP